MTWEVDRTPQPGVLFAVNHLSNSTCQPGLGKGASPDSQEGNLLWSPCPQRSLLVMSLTDSMTLSHRGMSPL